MPRWVATTRAVRVKATFWEPTFIRIMVADDDVDGAEGMAMLLTMDGHDVRVAGDGRQALALVGEFKPHVLLVDLGMREFNGLEVASQLKEDPRRNRMLMIAVTGWSTDEKRAAALAAGFDHYFVKPADFDSLGRIIGKASASGVFTD
jgi:CheY-like chemotaxis protein